MPIPCRRLVTDSLITFECQLGNGSWAATPPFGRWAYSPKKRSEIGRAFRDGKLVHIPSALHPQIAENLHEELIRYRGWTREQQSNTSNIQFNRRVLHCVNAPEGRGKCPPLLATFHEYIARDAVFWQQFPIVQLDSWTGWTEGPMATWYREGDFISPHSDLANNRAISFVLSLTKGWRESWGGSFWWFNGQPQCMTPAFNSLLLFLPSPKSLHLVTPVTFATRGAVDSFVVREEPRRLAVSGWFTARDPLHMQRTTHYLSSTQPFETLIFGSETDS